MYSTETSVPHSAQLSYRDRAVTIATQEVPRLYFAANAKAAYVALNPIHGAFAQSALASQHLVATSSIELTVASLPSQVHLPVFGSLSPAEVAAIHKQSEALASWRKLANAGVSRCRGLGGIDA
jgi:hypothetical protein